MNRITGMTMSSGVTFEAQAIFTSVIVSLALRNGGERC